MRCLLIIFFSFSQKLSIAQEILFSALENYHSADENILVEEDSIAGFLSFVSIYQNYKWRWMGDLRRLGEAQHMWYAKHKISGHDTLYPNDYYSYSKLPNLCDGQRVITMGYGVHTIRKGKKWMYEDEFIAIRLTNEINLDEELTLHFKYLVATGVVLDILTNSSPEKEGAFFIDQIIVSREDSGILEEFDKTYQNKKKQIGHDWVIFLINQELSDKFKFGQGISLMSPSACTCENNDKYISPDLYLKTVPYDLKFNFTSGSYEIISFDSLKFNEMIAYLKIYTEKKVGFIGHTDNVGNPDENMILSTQRAKSVFELFASNDINESRMQYKGMGDTKPHVANDTEEGRAQNRRVEVWIW